MIHVEKAITSILRQLFEKTGNKHDAHFKEGYGVLIVPEGYPCEQRFVVLAVDEFRLRIMNTTGQELNIHVG